MLTILLTSSFWISPRYGSSRTIHAPTTSPNLVSGTETAAASRIAGEAVRTFSIRTGKRFCVMKKVDVRKERSDVHGVTYLSASNDDILPQERSDSRNETFRARKLQLYLQPPDNLQGGITPNSDRTQTRIKKRLAFALTLNVTFLVHHHFITSTHPNLSILFIDPCHSPRLILVLPISNR